MLLCWSVRMCTWDFSDAAQATALGRGAAKVVALGGSAGSGTEPPALLFFFGGCAGLGGRSALLARPFGVSLALGAGLGFSEMGITAEALLEAGAVTEMSDELSSEVDSSLASSTGAAEAEGTAAGRIS